MTRHTIEASEKPILDIFATSTCLGFPPISVPMLGRRSRQASCWLTLEAPGNCLYDHLEGKLTVGNRSWPLDRLTWTVTELA
jgi:hypothetical protein